MCYNVVTRKGGSNMNSDNRIFNDMLDNISRRGLMSDVWWYSPSVTTYTYSIGEYTYKLIFTENSIMIKEFYNGVIVHKMVSVFGKVVRL